VRYLIGIDDTDNPDSRGTGFRARQLGMRLVEAGLGELLGITRHQLFVHPDIPYTSHNSSACLALRTDGAEGSDAGLCVAAAEAVPPEVVAFGRSAKDTILTQDQARGLAARHGLHLEGVTGDQMGVIGALSAVALRTGGHDGRFIWLKGVRELSGSTNVEFLLEETGVDAVETVDGTAVPREASVCVDPWPRPVLLQGRAVLLVQRVEQNDAAGTWELLPKEAIRRY